MVLCMSRTQGKQRDIALEKKIAIKDERIKEQTNIRQKKSNPSYARLLATEEDWILHQQNLLKSTLLL